jgi:alkylated DNA repair dioxygenase AlkB
MQRVIQNIDGTAYLDKGVFHNKELLEKCITYIEPLLLEKPEIIIYGRVCRQKRDVGFFSNSSIGYKYSNKLMKAQPLSTELCNLLININQIIGTNFNGILVNKYIDGNDNISAHSDDLTLLDHHSIVSISYGAERIFRIRNKNDKECVCNEYTTHCGILHMGGNFQQLYTHEIPIQRSVKDTRYSFTFRRHIVEDENYTDDCIDDEIL